MAVGISFRHRAAALFVGVGVRRRKSENQGDGSNEVGLGHAHITSRVRKSTATKSNRTSSVRSIGEAMMPILCAREQNRYT
jgi:hypothetical protein